jgi:hypothetical protein
VSYGVLLLIVAFVVVAFCGQVVQAVTGNVQKGTSRGGAAAAAAVLLVIALGLAWSARLVEHRAHQVTGAVPTSEAVRPRRHTPHSNRFAAVMLSIIVVIFGITTIVGFVDWHRSQSVQHRGLPAHAVVTQIHAVKHSSHGGSYDTYALDVALQTPISGRSRTIVHTPDGNPPASVGDTVAILIDRSDPGYGELPGEPANSIWTAIIGVALLLLIGTGSLLGALKHDKNRRSANASTS